MREEKFSVNSSFYATGDASQGKSHIATVFPIGIDRKMKKPFLFEFNMIHGIFSSIEKGSESFCGDLQFYSAYGIIGANPCIRRCSFALSYFWLPGGTEKSRWF